MGEDPSSSAKRVHSQAGTTGPETGEESWPSAPIWYGTRKSNSTEGASPSASPAARRCAGLPPRRRRGRSYDSGGPAGTAETAVSADAGAGGRVRSGTNRGGTYNLHPVPPGGTPGVLMQPLHRAPLSPARSGARLALLALSLFAASGCLGSFAPPPARPGMIRG